MSENNINITPHINKITVTSPDTGVTVNPTPDLTTVIVQSDQTKVVEVQTPGPQGPVGPRGPAGPTGSAEASGPIQAVQYNKDGTTVSGSSLFLFDDLTGLVTLTGSFELTGGVTGSLLGTASYANFANTASYALNALNAFSNLIYTGSVTASVNLTNDIFLIKSASVEMFKVNNEGVTILKTNNITPSAIAGGIFYSGSGDFFFGS